MVLSGTVRNVIDFGVFVDIGVHQDGLVHISQVCNRRIKHPSEIVQVGDVVTALDGLQRHDLVRILQEPKNALVKQYQKLFEYDDVDLEFEPEALDAIADKAIERNIGARGLRAVMEGLLTKIMYEIPSDPTVVKVVITRDCVEGTGEPQLTHDPEKVGYSVKLNTGKGESSDSAPGSAS
jgi:ATP-dependent Clp protease ATP-binding subunit ClpX